MSHATDALAALNEMAKIDPMSLTAFIDTHRLTAIATTHAMLAQAEAIDRNTKFMTAGMTASMTGDQAKSFLAALIEGNRSR